MRLRDFLDSCLIILGLLVVCLLIHPLPALALVTALQASAPEQSQLFHIPAAAWDEINTLLIGVLVAVMGTIAGAVIKWVQSKSPAAGVMARDAYNALAANAAKYGMTQLQAQETRVGDIDVGNAAVAATANFMIAQGPVIAKKVGFDVTTPEGQAAIIRSAALRVADLMTAPGAPPAAMALPASVAAPAAPSPK